MDDLVKHSAIFVLTGRGIETMLAEGGSQAWTIDAKRARDCQYVVCVQNHHQDLFDPKQLSADHHTAFLVGRLARITPADPGNGETRKKLEFSEYARIDRPNSWPGNRNPVFYGSLEDLGIDVDSLDFQPMPAVDPAARATARQTPLTIDQAKAGLALQFGVPVSNIEIVIRA